MFMSVLHPESKMLFAMRQPSSMVCIECDACNKALFSFISVAKLVVNQQHAFNEESEDDSLTADDYAMMSVMCDGLLKDDELLCLFALDTLCTAECDSEHKRYSRFNPELFGPAEFWKYFCFEKKDVTRLVSALAIPEIMFSESRVTWSGLKGLCILLWRLAYLNRLCDLVPMFGRSKSELSEIVNEMLFFLCQLHKDKLSTLQRNWVDLTSLCQAIHAKGAALAHVFGFIDGTTVCICRPSTGQEEAFSGHKRFYALKFQHVMLPNGIIAHSIGPFAGRRNDAAMYRDSGLDAELQTMQLHGHQLALFGDGGYANWPWLHTPFRGQLTQEQQAFNEMMSSVHISGEWGFAKVKTLFAFTNFYCNQKLFLQPLGNYFSIATLLANCHMCLYGSEISRYFGVTPPTLEEYLG